MRTEQRMTLEQAWIIEELLRMATGEPEKFARAMCRLLRWRLTSEEPR